jgi:O-antigen/teichoic acid export membrane protein
MFWRGVVGYLPVNLVQALAGFGAILVFTRLLSPADYGAYALAFSVTTLVHTCLFTWNEAAMARFYAAEPAETRRHLFATIYRTLAGMSVAIPALAALILLALPLSAQLKLAIGAGLASVVARSLLKLAQERRRAAGEVKGYAVLDIVQSGGGFLIGAALAIAGWGGASPLAGAGAASAICLIWALPSELKQARGGRFQAERAKAHVAYGLPLSLSLVMSLALATTDRFVIAGFLNNAAVGAYHAGYSLSNRTLDVMFLWLGMAGSPACVAALERGGPAALQRVAREQASFMLLIALPAAAGMALVARPLTEVMVGGGLRAAAERVTPWIAASALFSGLTTHYLHTAFTLARRTRRLMLAMAIPAAANLALTLALIPRFGLDGAVWATAASYGVGMITAFALGRDCLKLPIPWDALTRCALATAVMAVAVIALPALGGLPELLLKASVGAAVYGLMALVLDAGGSRSQAGRLRHLLRLRLAA